MKLTLTPAMLEALERATDKPDWLDARLNEVRSGGAPFQLVLRTQESTALEELCAMNIRFDPDGNVLPEHQALDELATMVMENYLTLRFRTPTARPQIAMMPTAMGVATLVSGSTSTAASPTIPATRARPRSHRGSDGSSRPRRLSRSAAIATEKTAQSRRHERGGMQSLHTAA